MSTRTQWPMAKVIFIKCIYMVRARSHQMRAILTFTHWCFTFLIRLKIITKLFIAVWKWENCCSAQQKTKKKNARNNLNCWEVNASRGNFQFYICNINILLGKITQTCENNTYLKIVSQLFILCTLFYFVYSFIVFFSPSPIFSLSFFIIFYLFFSFIFFFGDLKNVELFLVRMRNRQIY